MVSAELRERYYRQVLAPTFAAAEQFFHAQRDHEGVRRIDLPLTVRAIASAVLGLLVLQLLGDQEVAERWEELSEVLTTLLFDGVLGEKEVTNE